MCWQSHLQTAKGISFHDMGKYIQRNVTPNFHIKCLALRSRYTSILVSSCISTASTSVSSQRLHGAPLWWRYSPVLFFSNYASTIFITPKTHTTHRKCYDTTILYMATSHDAHVVKARFRGKIDKEKLMTKVEIFYTNTVLPFYQDTNRKEFCWVQPSS